MLQIEKKILGFIEVNLDKIVFGLLILISVYLRYKYTPLVNITNGGSDYKSELVPWVNYYREHGVIDGLVNGNDDYYVPYNLLLALASRFDIEPLWFIAPFSYIFDFLMAYYLYKIIRLVFLKEIDSKVAKCCAAFSLMIPMVVANSAIWKQCDSVYVALIFGGIYYLFTQKYNLSFIMIGIAFAFKLQTILILPFLIIAYYVLKEFSVLKFLWIPGMYLIAGLPAIFCGKRITRTYGAYYRQMNQYGAMTINTPNIYNIGFTEYMYHHVAMALTIMIFAFLVLMIYLKKPKFDHALLFYLAGWSAMTCFEFLPSMHERYDYLAIMLLTYVAICYRKRIIPAVLIMHLTSACTYGKFLYSFEVNYMVLSIAYLIAYVFISWDFMGLLFKEQNVRGNT